ncbi:MAG: 1,4-dihydroxy-2-naphthoate octaprenyltransferase [Candidatus Omnitrophica bacterium CG23_combo_of_CG06-09_8_20_14_all_40_11]|nr:MAG: 1,4-dihydroxy-2-naphthoate octaprenyltransferase [Candidatus Omnitrophica bacterium CG23_combo_of_CG06-09_8_20_14_all_40_11]
MPFFTATIIPVTLGSILAWYDTDKFMWPRFWLAMVGALLIHIGTNLANDYFDHLWGCDEKNPNPTPFSGGSRVIQDGLIAPKKILYASLVSFILGSGIGLYLNYLCGSNIILILGIVGVFLGFFYTAKPFRIGYGSSGELAVGIGFGPLMVLGSYYVQAQTLSFKVFLISIPVGILIALVLFINEFPDYEADKTVGKRTLVVILGKKKAVILYHILLASVYLAITALMIFKFLPFISLIIFLSLPLALRAYITSKKNFERIYELLPANSSTIGLHSIIGLLLSAGLLLDKLFFWGGKICS